MNSKNILTFASICFLISGTTIMGNAIGAIFDKECYGRCIGIGIGLIWSALIMLRIVRRMMMFNK